MDKTIPVPVGEISVYIAEPVVERWVAEADGDTPEELEARQELLDRLTGWMAPRP